MTQKAQIAPSHRVLLISGSSSETARFFEIPPYRLVISTTLVPTLVACSPECVIHTKAFSPLTVRSIPFSFAHLSVPLLLYMVERPTDVLSVRGSIPNKLLSTRFIVSSSNAEVGSTPQTTRSISHSHLTERRLTVEQYHLRPANS